MTRGIFVTLYQTLQQNLFLEYKVLKNTFCCILYISVQCGWRLFFFTKVQKPSLFNCQNYMQSVLLFSYFSRSNFILKFGTNSLEQAVQIDICVYIIWWKRRIYCFCIFFVGDDRCTVSLLCSFGRGTGHILLFCGVNT